MSIEDVSYLLENCQVDSLLMYVDSHKRRMSSWPTPSEYVVQFEEPFKMVHGFEVLDVSLPCVMYNVDANNNTLAYSTYDVNEPPVTLQQWLDECQSVKGFDDVFSGATNSEVLLCTQAQWDDNGASVLSTPAAGSPIIMVMVRTADTTVTSANLTDTTAFTITQGSSTLTVSAAANADVYAAWQAGLVALPTDGTQGVIMYKTYMVRRTLADVLKNKTAYMLHMYNYVTTVESGNYDINTLMLTLIATVSPVSVTSSTLGNVSKASKYLFNCANGFIFNMEKSTIRDILGFSTMAFDNDPNSNYAKLRYGTNQRLFGSVFNADKQWYQIVPPGIVNVSGMRYIILRCPEIEDHLQFGSINKKNVPGIGIFKLGGGNDVSYLRFDFVSLLRKPFHPIGKLTRLTLRFEMSDGTLYDFKGVDHQILINLKYYIPKNHVKFTKSVLNPSYDPDYMAYMTRQLELAQPYRTDPRHDDRGASSSSESSECSESETDSDDPRGDPRSRPCRDPQVPVRMRR